MMNLRDHTRTLLGSSKFDGRRTTILYAASLDGTDREVGTVDDFGWHGLIGRYVVREDNYGNVDHLTFDTVAEANLYLDAMETEDAWMADGTVNVAPDAHLEAAYEDAASMGGGDVDL